MGVTAAVLLQRSFAIKSKLKKLIESRSLLLTFGQEKILVVAEKFEEKLIRSPLCLSRCETFDPAERNQLLICEEAISDTLVEKVCALKIENFLFNFLEGRGFSKVLTHVLFTVLRDLRPCHPNSESYGNLQTNASVIQRSLLGVFWLFILSFDDQTGVNARRPEIFESQIGTCRC